jgi:hypothetical protein
MIDVDALISSAVERLSARLVPTPVLHQRAVDWMQQLSPTGEAAAYFRQPRAWPLLTLPAWVEESLGAVSDPAFQADLVYSSIAGYYHIRLVDDLMDHDAAARLDLLPLSGVLHSEFQGTYARYFPPDHFFWFRFAELWYGAAEATVADASLRNISLAEFRSVSALKVSPGKIPVMAVLCRHDRADLLPAWFDLCDRLAAIVQMSDDLFDWQVDLDRPERTTYFLSEADRRRARAESRTAWILREGFDWGVTTLLDWLADLRQRATSLRSPALDRHLAWREAALAEAAATLRPGFQALAATQRLWHLPLDSTESSGSFTNSATPPEPGVDHDVRADGRQGHE